MTVDYNEEMRKALEEIKDAPYDHFESGCSFYGEAIEWALKTIDLQKAEIEQLKTQSRIVRCKDCIIRDKQTKVCPTLQFSVPDTFFCAFGERPEAEGHNTP